MQKQGNGRRMVAIREWKCLGEQTLVMEHLHPSNCFRHCHTKYNSNGMEPRSSRSSSVHVHSYTRHHYQTFAPFRTPATESNHHGHLPFGLG